MQPYKRLAGKTGAIMYEIGSDYIWVLFGNGWRYLYTYGKPGQKDVEAMKSLAVAGRGLSTYISQLVQERYEKKERYSDPIS